MGEDRAGIHFVKQAERQFSALSEASQTALAGFLNGKLAELERRGGSRQGNFQEWEPGRVVYWDTDLVPDELEAGAETKPGAHPANAGSGYRIVVLKIRRFT